ncbi:MAG: Na+/H+ antiporter NhaC family protein [Bacilli bacterium]
MSEDKILKINKRSFITVCVILISFMIMVYIMTFFIEKGVYTDNTYQLIGGTGYPFWKFITSPFRLFAGSDSLKVIVISLFILILGGSFNVMDKTHGIKSIISYLIKKFKKQKYLLLYIVTLFFMLLGSLFGIFEEAVTLLPIIIILALSLGWDTFTGLGMCLIATGFGFSTALTNPFTIGLASDQMGLQILEGFWFRLIIFLMMYLILCIFLTIHVKKIEKDPQKSPTYEIDKQKLALINPEENFENYDQKILRVYAFFFLWVLLAIVLASSIPFLQDYTIPIIALSFLFGIFICGKMIGKPLKEISKLFWSGIVSLAPAIIMITLAASIKFILEDSQIMGTVINQIVQWFTGSSPIMGILFIYLVILVIQFFIGSASAKVILIIPIISIIANDLGITQNIALLAFIFGDGFTDLIYPTNPVLLIALGISSFSYLKWLKKTFVLQLIILALTIGLLILGFYIGY